VCVCVCVCMYVCVCVCVCAQRKEAVSFRKSVSDKEKKGFTTSTPDA